MSALQKAHAQRLEKRMEWGRGGMVDLKCVWSVVGKIEYINNNATVFSV